MDTSFIIGFSVTSILLAIFDFYYAYKAYRKVGEQGRFLGASAFSAGVVVICYLISIGQVSYRTMSIATSMYFAGIDWMLVSLTHFIYIFTGRHTTPRSDFGRKIIRSLAAIDSLVMVINIFSEIAVHYVYRETEIAPYRYEMRAFYVAHLIFTYALVLQIFFILITKIRNTPVQYRSQYYLIIFAIGMVVLVNAIFLYPTGIELWTLIDYSVLGYSLGLYITYWAAFEYRYNYMPKSLSMTIFENIGQGIVLFDYGNELIMRNDKADQLLRLPLKEKMPMSGFVEDLQLPKENDQEDRYSVQIDRGENEPLRCDYTRLRDDRGGVIGNLFVFTEAVSDTDLLTGFQLWKKFRRLAAEHPELFDHPAAAVVFDLIGLGEINRTFGREVGDQRIRNLVRTMKTHMPEGTYFVRGFEASLIAVVRHSSEKELREYAAKVIAASGETVLSGVSETLDPVRDRFNSTAESDNHNEIIRIRDSGQEYRNIIEAVEQASRSLQVKKLLNPRSLHSHALSSLIKALQESDSETEAHVQRTQKMGEVLGLRIGLTDSQLSDLKLLCLLHDIGKIGVPLEILNKPGKLSDNEWIVLRTHPEKGYQICMSSEELRPIAQMVLCHHERWDGRGYPGHLAGESIPLLSRIISIVDAYDAMVNDRPYRKGLSVEAAKTEIKNCSGTQFDPYLGKEFLAMLEENPDIAEGVHTDAKEIGIFAPSVQMTAGEGNTYPVVYSRYLLGLDERILEIDSQFTELTGYSAAEALKMTQIDLIPPEDRQHYMIMVSNQFAKSSIVFLQHDILRKDQTKVSVFCMGKRFFDSAVKEFRSEIIITVPKKTDA